MFDWNHDLFARHSPWPARSRGVGRRPKPAEAPPEAEPLEQDAPPPSEAADSGPKSVLKKAGWVEAATKFKTEAEIFAEFDIPESEKHRTQADFQVLRRGDGKFLPYKSVQGKVDASGRATARLPIQKDQADTEVFRIQARHGGAEWSDGKGTDREVTESADDAFEHVHVSGLHFPKDSSFIVPGYLKAFREVEKAYTEWRKTHPKAKVVAFGHAERDEEDPRKLSARRAQIAFAFLIGDFQTWGRIAREERWGVWEQQHMLNALGFYDGVVDGVSGPKTEKAILAFITRLNEEECKAINPDLGFTEEYIRLELYRVYVTGPKRAVSFPSERFRTVSGYPYVGCGAFNRYKAADGHHGENRRATFVLISENQSFPAPFPCKSTPGPCEGEAGKSGGRAVQGFSCKFYDDLVKAERPNQPELIGSLVKANGQYGRISFDGYSGQGYVIKDFRKYEGGAIQLRPEKKVLAPPTPIPKGFKNECASLVQFFGIPQTSLWRKGPRVCDLKPGSLPEGTVVATLRDGVYHSDYSGRSHVGIYLAHDDYQEYRKSKNGEAGIRLFHQYNGAEISVREFFYAKDSDSVGKPAKKPWVDAEGTVQKNRVEWMKDGEEYYVLLV